MEEQNAWRNPVDLVALLERAFARAAGAPLEAGAAGGWPATADALVETVLGDEPAAIVDALLDGAARRRRRRSSSPRRSPTPPPCASPASPPATSSATGTPPCTRSPSPTRSTRALRRSPSPELLRGVFDAAMSVYLDRFLNVPPARLPDARPDGRPGGAAGRAAGAARPPAAGGRGRATRRAYLAAGGDPRALIAALGAALAARGPRLPHHPVSRGGGPPARAARGHGRGDAAAGRGRPLPGRARPDHPRAAARPTTSPGACTAARPSTRTSTRRREADALRLDW